MESPRFFRGAECPKDTMTNNFLHWYATLCLPRKRIPDMAKASLETTDLPGTEV
jgi:hypothetical protein